MEKLKVNMVVEEDENLLESMKEAYLNCAAAVKYCTEIGIPEEKIDKYIPYIYDFVSDINYCKKCPGIQNCKKNNPLLISKIIYKDNIVSTQLVPCKELLRQTSFERQFKVKDFTEEWSNKKLKDLDESKERKTALIKYVDFVKGTYRGWIYLTGGVGSGKSFFAAVLASDAARRELGPIAFINCAQRLRELNDVSFKKNNDFQDLFDMYCNVPILVMDDFGNEFKNDFVRDAIVYPILSYRASKKLLTIITSDFTMEEIKTLYSTNKQSEIRAKQILKCLQNECGQEINLGDLKVY